VSCAAFYRSFDVYLQVLLNPTEVHVPEPKVLLLMSPVESLMPPRLGALATDTVCFSERQRAPSTRPMAAWRQCGGALCVAPRRRGRSAGASARASARQRRCQQAAVWVPTTPAASVPRGGSVVIRVAPVWAPAD
jgi:hypothetical protein